MTQVARPILSIITICFENPIELNDTLSSVYPRYDSRYVEQIVIDGSRSDRCQILLAQHAWVDVSLHGEDKGRYDAMNKGVEKANGTYLLFLNSGDKLYDGSHFSDVINSLCSHNGRSIIFGDHIEESPYHLFFKKISKKISSQSFRYGPSPSHQAIFFPRWLCKRYPYEVRFSISADTLFFIKAFADAPAVKIDQCISVFSLGGVSNLPTSFAQVFLHWNEYCESRDLRKIRRINFLLVGITKMLLIKMLGTHFYYKYYLPRRSSVVGTVR